MDHRQIAYTLSLVIFVSLIFVDSGNGEVNLFPHKPEGSEFWGHRDRDTGKYVIEPRFDDAFCFSKAEGLAAVKVGGRWGYGNKAGKVGPLLIICGDISTRQGRWSLSLKLGTYTPLLKGWQQLPSLGYLYLEIYQQGGEDGYRT